MRPRLPQQSRLDLGDLPVVELAAFAKRESRRPRPIYGVHKWFARRLGTAFRALAVASVTGPHEDFWENYYSRADLTGLTVLDTFVGGGTAVVEAQRLGASVIGFDVDPVATAITRFELTAHLQPDPEEVLSVLTARVAGRMKRYHQTTSADGRDLAVVHHFWVQVVPCADCDADVEAHPTWQLAADERRKLQWVLCRGCGEVLERPLSRSAVRCSGCRTLTHIATGTVQRGILTCPHCSKQERLIDAGQRTGRPPTWRLVALEVLDVPESNRRVPMRERSFQAATLADRELVKQAERQLRRRQREGKGVLPEGVIPEDRHDDRLLRYGYRSYMDLFNPRQLLHLSLLLDEINKLPEPQRNLAAIAFSNHLTTSCMLTSYAAGWRRLVPLFSVRAFRHVPRPVEVNPWLDGTGRGTYPNALRQIAAAIEFARQPRELSDDGFVGVDARQPLDEPRVVCGSSEKLSGVADASVSLVLSDPPYLDNIAYSELADFFVPWLRSLGVIDAADPDRARSSSLAAKGRTVGDADDFAERLGTCFQEAARVLDERGRLVFTYQHQTANGWYALAQALSTAWVEPVSVFPLQGDGGFGLHAHEGTSVFDAVLVFKRVDATGDRTHRGRRPGGTPRLLVTSEGVSRAVEHATAWSELLTGELPGVFRAPDAANLLRAALVMEALGEGRSRRSDGLPLLQVLEDLGEDAQRAHRAGA